MPYNHAGDTLKALGTASIHEKAQMIQQFYENLIFHESGIMYSLMKIDGREIRPFEPRDFEGKAVFDYSQWRIQPKGHWENLNNENSITTSGIYLASQCYRYMVTKDPAAMVQAGKAFQSLNLIYQFGEEDGRPGWMGKPYGFRLSDQTSGDQYLDAVWGLYTYMPLAPDEHRVRIKEMLIGFADYWRSIDYKIVYINSLWDNKNETRAYNLIFLSINLIAYSLSNDPIHLREAEYFMNHGKWHMETNVDAWKREYKNGQKVVWKFDKLVEGHLHQEEHLCWESTIHAKFVAIAAEIISSIEPSWMKDRLEPTLINWWKTWNLGIEEDLLPYYFFIVDVNKGTWRPAPRTKVLPKEDRPLGHPFLSYTSQVRWMEPLCRFMFTSVLGAKHALPIKENAQGLALRIMESVDETRMRWMHDPDGEQVIRELSYMTNVLSSEMPATYLATYWRGRLEQLW